MNNLRHRRWAYNLPLASYFHARDSYIPPRDDLLGSQLELETRPLQAVVEHLVVLLQTSFIVDLQIFITKLNIMKIWVIEYKIKRMQNRKAKHFFSTKKILVTYHNGFARLGWGSSPNLWVFNEHSSIEGLLFFLFNGRILTFFLGLWLLFLSLLFFFWFFLLLKNKI